MSANTQPIFVLTPRIGLATISVANANRDGTGTLVTVITGAANGTRINRITIKAAVTVTNGMVRLFLYDGTNTRLYLEQKITATTPSATAKSFELVIPLKGEDALLLPYNWSLKASTEKAESINVIAQGGDY